MIISGRVLNREVYPKEKEVKLVLPCMPYLETIYTSPIADDGTFSFRFSPYASTREVVLRNYAEHLYVHPGDSLHVEIDFSCKSSLSEATSFAKSSLSSLSPVSYCIYWLR